ncbi:MAG: hypothetical protein AAF462_03360 [Thermodesulfobacteriota bacterium]
MLAVILLCSCDSEITGSVSSETIPKQISAGCALDQDIAHSDCPAIEITNICDPFLCRVASGQVIEEEIELASDYTLPECERECRAMDCSTIECLDSNVYSELDVAIGQDGEISVTGILNNEIVFTCLSRTACGQ